MARSLVERLAELTDRRGRQYPMVGLLTRCRVAILAGHTTPEASAPFGRLRQKRLGHALGFKNGNIPCANTIAGLLRNRDADHWTGSSAPGGPTGTPRGGSTSPWTASGCAAHATVGRVGRWHRADPTCGAEELPTGVGKSGAAGEVAEAATARVRIGRGVGDRAAHNLSLGGRCGRSIENNLHHTRDVTLGGFSAPLSRLATEFVETWEFERLDTGTRVARSFEMHARSAFTRPVLWPISLLLKRAIARHLRQIGTPVPARRADAHSGEEQ